MPPGDSRRGHRKRGADFFRHEIYRNSVSYVEAGMGMEGQIMFMEQCTF